MNNDDPRNTNDILGVCLSRMVGTSSRFFVVSFCAFEPATDHAPYLHACRREFGEPRIVEAPCGMREAQVRDEYLQLNIGLVEDQEARRPALALCEVQRLQKIEYRGLDTSAERVARHFRESYNALVS